LFAEILIPLVLLRFRNFHQKYQESFSEEHNEEEGWLVRACNFTPMPTKVSIVAGKRPLKSFNLEMCTH
jgi:hypothetical protein